MKSLLLLLLFALAAASGVASPAHAWDPFERDNPDVAAGNAAMADEDYDAALEAYARAAAAHPSDPRIHLNRGIALLHQAIRGRDPEPGGPATTPALELLSSAREALVEATGRDAAPEVRADALYDLGLSFYHEGDELADAENHESAQEAFEEAVDALRRALRLRPSHEDTAWNYELALRRLREQEQAAEEQRQQQEETEQAEQEQQEGQEDEEGEQEQDGEPEEQSDSGDEGQEQPQDGPEDGTDEGQPDGQEGDDASAGGDEEEAPPPEPEAPPDEPSTDETGGEGEDEGSEGSEEPAPAETQDDALPSDVSRVLNSLRDSEENLQRFRARDRARRENRRPTMDW